MKLLHIDTSITGAASVSRTLSAAIVTAAREAVPGLEIARRDLATDPIPHLDAGALAALRPSADARPDPVLAARDAVILEEFLAADIVVIGAPMYNLGIPSQLKAWIDRILVAGRTFRYSETGPVGLAGGKSVIVASARGGLYAPGTAASAADFQEPYLRAVFGFIGIGQVEFLRAEGVALGDEPRKAAIAAALAAVPGRVTPLVPASALAA